VRNTVGRVKAWRLLTVESVVLRYAGGSVAVALESAGTRSRRS
jgi:hypothetical protein